MKKIITTFALALMAAWPATQSVAGISMVNDLYSRNGEKGMSSRCAYRAISVDQSLGGLKLKAVQDARTKRSYNGSEITSTNKQFMIESDRSKPFSMAFSRNNTDMGNGTIMNTQSLGFDAKPIKRFSLSLDLTNKSVNSFTQSQRELTAGWAMTDRLNFSVRSISTTVGGHSRPDNTSYRISGSLPDKVKLIKNVMFLTTQNAGGNVASAVRFESPVLSGNLSCEFADKGNIGWSGPYKQVMIFAANRGKEKNIRFETRIKKRGTDSGIEATVSDTTVTYALNPKTSVRLVRYNNKETPFNTVDWVKGVEMGMNTSVQKCSVGLNYKNDVNLFSRARHTSCGLNLAATQDNGGKINAGVALDSYKGVESLAYTVNYDRQVNDKQFVTLTTEIRAINDHSPGVRRTVQTWLDLRTVFF